MARTIQQTLTTGAAGGLDEPIKKHKPKDTRLRQQRLPAWQPILDAKTVIPVFITISLLFIPVGIVLIITSNSVKEWAQYYDIACENQLKFGSNICIFDISLEEDFLGDVYFYYELENYYQNHRRYMRSRNDLQMLGRLDEVSDCSPFDYLDGTKIAPCGAIANSMFNDTFTLKEKYTGRTIEWSYEELIWPADRTKFINPKCSNGDCQTINDLWVFKTSHWIKPPCQLDIQNVQNSGFQNADFIIWMRTAAFPDFRKPYRKLKDPNYTQGLLRGNYTLEIGYNYNVSAFSGRKSFVISTTSWLGGKNPFLGFAYIAVGILCAIFGFVFIFIHIKYGHTLREMAVVELKEGEGAHSHSQ
uniref:Uncharacterized protein n=2 Tax=Meloidogyne enterolobii TaxID=390850 RepID=A0A6V7XZ81_MELEN|nr:unnamed protein product [Meloidogyne enterolobii]